MKKNELSAAALRQTPKLLPTEDREPIEKAQYLDHVHALAGSWSVTELHEAWLCDEFLCYRLTMLGKGMSPEERSRVLDVLALWRYDMCSMDDLGTVLDLTSLPCPSKLAFKHLAHWSKVLRNKMLVAGAS